MPDTAGSSGIAAAAVSDYDPETGVTEPEHPNRVKATVMSRRAARGAGPAG